MNRATQKSRPASVNHHAVNELALSLTQAEEALRAFTSDQVDAILDSNGRPYLLRPAQEFLLNSERTHAALPKDRFLAMLVHELRTPLMPVLLGISELQEDGRFADAKPILDMMRRNIELQARLLEELMDFTSIGQHKLRLRNEMIDVHDAVRYVMEICRTEFTAARIEVKLDLKASNSTVLADSLRLQQVMWNLLRNAIKFSPPGGSISISSANEEPEGVTLLFVDHGIGIEPKFLPHVFEPFKQGERAGDQKQYGGLGLGMFIAKGLAEAQEGSLTVTSEGPALGTTFCLTLKLAPIATVPQPNLPLFELKTAAEKSPVRK